jgi:hypothetical protein
MRFRTLLLAGAVATLTPLTAPVPAAASAEAKPACQNHWNGKWNTASGNSTYGVVNFKQKNGETAVTGTYKFSGGGTISATAGGTECWTLYGRWKDKLGQGDFYVWITPGDTGNFTGWYRRCKSLCWLYTKYNWHGSLL